jgi:hypothetical protein
MDIKKIHYISGLTISIFVGLHLFNHFYSILGADKHIEVMKTLRHFYRNIFVETILLLAVAAQIYSGLKLFRNKRKSSKTFFEKLQIWSGLYLAIFFIIHLSAILAGRHLLNLDTNFHFGVAGLNSFPTNLFFIPYYSFAIISFFGHITAIHNKKMNKNILGLTPLIQSKLILILGICLTFIIIYGLTNHFKGFEIPTEYNILIGK